MAEFTLNSVRPAPGEIWLGSAGYPVDIAGGRDNSPVIQQALTDASNQDLAVRVPMGVLGMGSAVELFDNTRMYGVQGSTASNYGEPQGTIFKPLTTFSTASVPVYTRNDTGTPAPPGVFYMDGINGGADNEIMLENFWVDCSRLSTATAIDGVTAYGTVQAVLMEKLGVYKSPGRGISAYQILQSATLYTPIGWHLYGCHADTSYMDGFYGYFKNTSSRNCRSRNNGTSGTGHGLYCNGGNNNWADFRGEQNASSGMVFDAYTSGTGFEDPNLLVGCMTQRNAQYGLLVTNSAALGAAKRLPVKVYGCSFDADGTADNGSLHYSGVRVEGRNEVTISADCNIGTSVIANGAPMHALSVGVAGGGSALPTVDWVEGVLNYPDPGLIPGTSAVYDPSGAGPRVMSACRTAIGYKYGTATVPLVPWLQQAWQEIATGATYQNSWADSGFGDPGAWRYIADTNEIEVIADLAVPTFAADSTIFTIPGPNLPASAQWFPATIKTSTGSPLVVTPNVQVSTSGVVKAIFNSIPGASTGLTTRMVIHFLVSLDI
jgi:hypothetical protein